MKAQPITEQLSAWNSDITIIHETNIYVYQLGAVTKIDSKLHSGKLKRNEVVIILHPLISPKDQEALRTTGLLEGAYM